MVGMLVLGGGGGGMGWLLPQSWWCNWTLFGVWSICEVVRRVRARSGAFFGARSPSRRVWGVPSMWGGSFQVPIVITKGPEGPH